MPEYEEFIYLKKKTKCKLTLIDDKKAEIEIFCRKEFTHPKGRVKERPKYYVYHKFDPERKSELDNCGTMLIDFFNYTAKGTKFVVTYRKIEDDA